MRNIFWNVKFCKLAMDLQNLDTWVGYLPMECFLFGKTSQHD